MQISESAYWYVLKKIPPGLYDLLVPQNGRSHRTQMPQRVCIHAAPQHRRKVKQLQAHRQHDPRDGETGPGSPAAPGVLVLGPRVPAPEDVLHEAARNVGRHVVRVVPAPQLEVRNVAHVHGQTQQRPGAQDGAPAGRGPVEPEVVHDGIVQSVEHV